MARTDLLPEYSGWQALDATCQEKGKGKTPEMGLSKSRGEVKQGANKAIQCSSFPIFQWKDAKGQELTHPVVTLGTKLSFTCLVCAAHVALRALSLLPNTKCFTSVGLN